MSNESTFEFPRTTPEAQGIPSAAVLAFLDAVEGADLGLHSLMIVRHGSIVAEGWWSPYAAERPHVLFSLSKSFAATGIGLAVAEGKLSLDDTVLSFFPEDAPETVSPNLAAMRVRHLLSMSTGNDKDTTGAMRSAETWARGVLAQPVEHEPGTHFVYNSGASYLLSAIVQKVTGERLLEYLRPRLLDPLGITGATWDQSPEGIDAGGWGLNIRTEDIARFGQLYLQKGVWQNQRLLTEDWIAEATSKQVSNGDDPNNDWNQGYGFQFWRCRHNAYRGDGAFGQYCVVMPDQDAVIAITSGTRDMGAVLRAIWDHLLPAVGDAALPADAATQGQLTERLANLRLPYPQGDTTSPTAARVSGKTYRFVSKEAEEPELSTFRVDFGENGSALTITDKNGEHRIELGSDDWQFGTTTLHGGTPSAVAARGVWTAPDTYVATLCFVETPFIFTGTAHFTGDRLRLERGMNVGFGPTGWPDLEGHAE